MKYNISNVHRCLCSHSEVVDVLRYGFLPKERVFYFTLSQAAWVPCRCGPTASIKNVLLEVRLDMSKQALINTSRIKLALSVINVDPGCLYMPFSRSCCFVLFFTLCLFVHRWIDVNMQCGGEETQCTAWRSWMTAASLSYTHAY